MRLRPIYLIWFVVLILTLALIFHAFVEDARSRSGRTRDASNLKAIGESCALYAADHQGHLPKALGDLMLERDPLDPTRFLTGWGQADRSAPKGMSPNEAANWVNQHAEYTYVGRGRLSRRMTALDVLVYDNVKFVSRNNGLHIGFGDGHVEWRPDGLEIIAGKPATTPVTMPTYDR